MPDNAYSLIPADQPFAVLGALFAIALFAFSFSALADIFTPFHAQYNAYRNGSKLGTANQLLEKLSDNQFRLTYQTDVSYFFLSDKRKEVSVFDVNDNRILPYQYHYERTGTGSDHQLFAQFDHQAKKIKVAADEAPIVDLPLADTIDNQLIYFAIKQQLLTGSSHFVVPALNYRGEVTEFVFEVEKNETLTLPFGKVDTIKVKRIREGSSRETFAWFAPDMDYLMVRLRQLKEGDEQGDIKLHRFTQH